MTLGVDELNTISIEEEIRRYFSVMDISDAEKREREGAAKSLFPIFLFLFALIENALEYDLSYEFVLTEFRIGYGRVAYQYYEDAGEYIDRITKEVLDATLKEKGVLSSVKKDGYWTSLDRAIELGENEANSLLNYQKLKEAIENGYTKKQWRTERDNRVRESHTKMEGLTIPINEYFQFEDCRMLCPHDVVNGTARQVSNCRCSLLFLK